MFCVTTRYLLNAICKGSEILVSYGDLFVSDPDATDIPDMAANDNA